MFSLFTKREWVVIFRPMTTERGHRISIVRQLLIELAAMAGIGVLLALLGPFGSFAAPFAWRLIYWLTLAIAGYFLFQPMCALAGQLAPRLDLPEPALWVAACLVASLPMTAVVWIIGHLPGHVPWPSLNMGFATYGYVLVVGGGITLIFYVAHRGARKAEPPGAIDTPEERAPPVPTPPFLDRLPPHLGTDLIALEMEDHYVRAHTALGSDLILMRMRDAVMELNGVEGTQVHRSWWVARHAVRGMAREGRNVRLKLTGDLTAPVARANVAVLEAEGWW